MWPHGALIILAFVVVGAIGALLWQKYERHAEASSLPNAARIERVDGQAGVNQTATDSTNSKWISATPNMPVTVGDRIYTKQNSRTQIGFTGRNLATLDANTSLDVLDLSQQRTQVALREGSALFDVGSVASGDLFEVATPCGAVDFQQPGLYQIAINDSGNAVATVFNGQAQVVGQGGSGRIQKGEYLAVPCQGNAPAVMSKVEPNQAGYLIDNYYRSRYPKKYDGRYRNYYTYLDDPDYYDPWRSDASYNYVSDYVPGIYDLDDYGDWQYVSDYGYAWHPRVDTGWAPYESGYWTMDYPYGLTWVSNEPWGYAPYHYGRWAYASNEWFWVPGSINTYPTYSPALTAFIPLGNSSVAWVALGPSDPYQVTYYDPYWQPTYTYPSNVVVDRLVNINVPGAVTVVPTYDFGRVIDPTIVTRVDPQTLASVRPVLNPLTVDPLRTAAFQTRETRQRIDVPRQVEQQIVNTPVVASTIPTARFNRDLARSLRVEPVAAQAKNQKLQISDQRAAQGQVTQPSNIAAEQARERQMADLAKQSARGDRNARQQMQELRKQQLNPGSLAGAGIQAQGQPVGQPVRPQDQRQMLRQQQQAQREAERQQTIQSQQQQRAAAQQQIQAAREQRRQNQIQQAPVRHSQQQQVLSSQPARPQPQAQPRPQAQPKQQMVRPSQAQPRPQPQAQPRPQAQPKQEMVRPPQAQPQPRPQAQPQARPQPQQKQQGPPAAQSKAPGKKHP
jgi:hypothetical protein